MDDRGIGGVSVRERTATNDASSQQRVPGQRDAADRQPTHGRPGRLRTVLMIAVLDVGGPLLAYSLLRDLAHLPTVGALMLSGLLPAFGVLINAIQYRRLDIFGLMILGGIALGSVIGLTTHDPKLYLLEGSLPSAVFAVLCLASLKTGRPLIYRIALELLGPDSRKGRQISSAFEHERFRRTFRLITVVWAIGYLAESALRALVAVTTSTGIALVISKAAPYIFAGVLAAWTLAYGERKMRLVLARARTRPS